MIRPIKIYWPWVLLLAGLPLAAVGLLLSPNEYESWGGAGIDCDGPFLLFFSVPAMGLYVVCAITLTQRSRRGKSWLTAISAFFCVVLVVALGIKSLAAYLELQKPDHWASCVHQLVQ